VIAHPRTISATNTEILWQLADGVIRMPANGTRELFVKYEGFDSVRVGAKEVSITDLTFKQGSATVTVSAKANGAELLFTNTTGTGHCLHALERQRRGCAANLGDAAAGGESAVPLCADR
jgi:hypothetical protein